MEAITPRLFIASSDEPWETPAEGILRQVLGYDEHLMMVRVVFRKGAVGYLHRHPHRQVTLVERGSFEVTIEGEKKVLKGGDSYFIPPDLLHGAVALEDGVLVDVFAPMREDFVGANT
jgi:quercetin dioxygenase-like cupin family protein